MKILKYISYLLTVFVVASCSEDFLTKTSFEDVNTESFYKTESDAIAAINAAYQPLQRPKLYNMRIWTTDIIAGNSEVGANPSDANDGSETKSLANFTASTDNAGVLDLWRGPWPGILYCNIVLDKVPAIQMDSTLKNRILGEAKFLRGLYYFILVRCFGDVPLITEPAWGKPGEDHRPHRVAKEEIYKLIIKDFSEAIGLLPFKENYSGSDIGRASKGSAAGMLAKVYLTLGKTEYNYTRVANLCDSIKSWGYTLNPKYEDNFNSDAENTIESLFEIQYIGNTPDFWADNNNAAWHSNFMGPRDSPLTTVGWGWSQPTQEFVDSYEAGDLRKDVTVFYAGCPKFDGKDYDPSWAYVTGYNVRKFVMKSSYLPAWNSGSPLNFPVLRYADVLLMKAEALNELGMSLEAENALNEVRVRAGLANITGLTKDDFREKVLHERRMELAFEGDRWFDLIRVNDGTYALDFLHSIGKANANVKHLLLPIPQQEIDANPNLLPNNPGY